MQGLRVVDLSTDIGGAYCARLLASCGADVTLVEPPEGDALRRQPPLPPVPGRTERVSARHEHLNAYKRGIVVDRSTVGRAAGARRAAGRHQGGAEFVQRRPRAGAGLRAGGPHPLARLRPCGHVAVRPDRSVRVVQGRRADQLGVQRLPPDHRRSRSPARPGRRPVGRLRHGCHGRHRRAGRRPQRHGPARRRRHDGGDGRLPPVEPRPLHASGRREEAGQQHARRVVPPDGTGPVQGRLGRHRHRPPPPVGGDVHRHRQAGAARRRSIPEQRRAVRQRRRLQRRAVPAPGRDRGRHPRRDPAGAPRAGGQGARRERVPRRPPGRGPRLLGRRRGRGPDGTIAVQAVPHPDVGPAVPPGAEVGPGHRSDPEPSSATTPPRSKRWWRRARSAPRRWGHGHDPRGRARDRVLDRLGRAAGRPVPRRSRRRGDQDRAPDVARRAPARRSEPARARRHRRVDVGHPARSHLPVGHLPRRRAGRPAVEPPGRVQQDEPQQAQPRHRPEAAGRAGGVRPPRGGQRRRPQQLQPTRRAQPRHRLRVAGRHQPEHHRRVALRLRRYRPRPGPRSRGARCWRRSRAWPPAPATPTAAR